MSKRFDRSKAYNWGIHGYMPGAYKNGKVSRTNITHMSATEPNEDFAVEKATKWANEYSGMVYIPYFSVPTRNPKLGDYGNKGVVGFAYKSDYTEFSEPVGFFDALEQIEEYLKIRRIQK